MLKSRSGLRTKERWRERDIIHYVKDGDDDDDDDMDNFIDCKSLFLLRKS